MESIPVLVNFIVVVIVLVKYTRQPLMDFLRNRSVTLATQMQEASELSASAERELGEWKGKWKDAEAIAHRHFEDTKQTVQKFREQVLAHARTESSRILRDAKVVGESESQKAEQSLRHELVHSSVKVARNYLTHHLEDKDRLNLVTEYLETVPNGHAG